MPSSPRAERCVRVQERLRLLSAFVVWALTACASAPKQQYLVHGVRFEGARQVSAAAIQRCLATVPRPKLAVGLGITEAACEEPPFDRDPLRAELWSWPWTDWPGLDLGVLDIDRQRIERFYRARGFYDAKVVDVRFDPRAAGAPELRPARGQCDPKRERCPVDLTIVIEEGRPLKVGRVALSGAEGVAASLTEATLPRTGARFDEREYGAGKESLASLLAEAGYADAKVAGEVQLDHARGEAHISYRIMPGIRYRFGRVEVRGHGSLPSKTIVAAAGVEQGGWYRRGTLVEVQQDVYALSAFSAVEVTEQRDPAAQRVHLRIHVTPLPRDVFRMGVGIASGSQQRTEAGVVRSVPQWDGHLSARYERRHVLGSLGRVRFEVSPKLIVQRPFPELARPQPGHLLRVTSTVPGLVEARTELVSEAFWDYGPDPFRDFRRSDLALRLFLKRPFLRRKLSTSVGVEFDRLIVAPGTRTIDGSPLPVSYWYSFLEQEVRLDLRDDPARPSRGAHLSVLASQALRAPCSDWTALQVAPDARAYVPLPLKMVLAMRVAVAAMFILDARSSLDAESRRLGPNTYRLRGGGPQSNRGFIAGELGARPQSDRGSNADEPVVDRTGGVRRWEASVELRVPLGPALSTALFFDMGDVNEGKSFRFDQDHYNPALGFGFRYATLVGVARVDLGFRLRHAEGANDSQLLFGAPGVLHATLGEAF